MQFRGLIENTKFMNAEHAYKCYRSITDRVLVVSSSDKTKNGIVKSKKNIYEFERFARQSSGERLYHPTERPATVEKKM